MHGQCAFQTMVESPADGLCLIRVAGRLDQAAAASVLRLVDAQLELVACGHRTTTDLVVDIEAVGSVDPAGLHAMRHAAHSTDRRGVGLYISGCGGRLRLLPLRTQHLLARFRTFPTAEVAVAALVSGIGPAPTGIGDPVNDAGLRSVVPAPRWPQEDGPRVGGAGPAPRAPRSGSSPHPKVGPGTVVHRG